MPKVIEISPEAQRIMVAGFRERKPAAMIARLIQQQLGEDVAERTIGRRASEWRAEQNRRQTAREQMQDMVSAMKANDYTAEEMVIALGAQALQDRAMEVEAADVINARKIEIQRRQLDLRERQVAVEEGKLRLLEDREKRAIAAVADESETLTPEERLKRIREIYGLN